MGSRIADDHDARFTATLIFDPHQSIRLGTDIIIHMGMRTGVGGGGRLGGLTHFKLNELFPHGLLDKSNFIFFGMSGLLRYS